MNLHRGSHGAKVRILETRLARLGLPPLLGGGRALPGRHGERGPARSSGASACG